MRGVWNFLSDPSLHLLAIALVLIGLAIGSTGSKEPTEESPVVFCTRCHAYHYSELVASCRGNPRIAQARP
jgi:hypothetical protein